LESCPCRASWDLQSSFHGRSIFQNAIRHLTSTTVHTDTNNRDALVISDHSPPQFSPTDPLQKLGIFFNATHTLAGCPSIPPLPRSCLDCTYTAYLSISGIPLKQPLFPTPSESGSHPL
jgi:hypothetical protein